ncbi:myosin-9-like [Hyposmocoma kahamanoa]|uniref:myosin-9-like n=1 Tax=Hyposmocoma kahamanoa TaxID=1477025 RepID=UPI000E6D7E88|nr:myosin-9-like [Hyposmocoma kahamanoa]
MDITDINKVANRKRMTADVEKLRERVSRENKKIIKLKVTQDTAYWDLKQKLRGVEINHAKLQQNMLEVQMQYETVSGQYQEELRQKPEVLNKLGSTREICNVLAEYGERLRETLSRCKADQSALCESYQQSEQVVCKMKTQQLQNEEKNKQVIENLQDKLKMTTEHQSQLVQYFTTEQQRVDAELVAVKNELASVQTSKEQLIATNADRNRQLDQYRQELEEKEEAVAHLRRDIKQLIHDYNGQAAEMKLEMSRVEKELKEVTASNDSLKTALNNQETYIQSICEENNALQEKHAALEQEQKTTGNIVKELRANIQDATKDNASLKAKLGISMNQNKCLEKEIINKTQLLVDAERDKQELLSKISIIEKENCEIIADLNKVTNEVESRNVRIQELTIADGGHRKQIEAVEDALKVSRDAAGAKITELTTIIETKNQELDSKASTISRLTTEVMTAVDARVTLEIALQNTKSDRDTQRRSTTEKEQKMTQQIKRLEVVVRTKDNHLSKHMNSIMELRSDKEHLQHKIRNMQNKIDNIQKELTRPSIQPELEDNAVMLTPSNSRVVQ